MRILNSTRSITISFLITIVIIFSSINCSKLEQKYYTHPNSYIVDQLNHKKIIMLADWGHLYPLPYKSLIFLLNKWLEKVENGKSSNNNIILILETDSEGIKNINEFLSTGNLEPLIQYWLPYRSLEWVEFYTDLRKLKLKIDSLNVKQKFIPNISLTLFGGENNNNFNHPEFLKMTREEGSKYFVNIRDSLTAKNIIDYLRKDDNKKAIIFYGNLHLIKNYVNKNIAKALPDSESYGYYLAHYLKKEFGEDSVLSIQQRTVNEQTIENSPFSSANGSNIFVSSNEIPWKNLKPKDYDGFILRNEIPAPSHNLSYIFSKNVIAADIKIMEKIKKYLPGYLAAGYYDKAEGSLKLLTGQNFNDLNKWQKWICKNHFPGFSRLDTKEFENQLYDNYFANPYDKKIQYMLFKFGFGPEILNDNYIAKEEWESIWKHYLPQIKYLNAVGILWVGTPEEKLEAEKYLATVSDGSKADEKLEPQDYLKLYRQKYYKTDY